MSYEFKFPDVGEGITEGKLVGWKIKVGDNIKTDQAIADVETDKAVVEIPSPVDGTVEELLFKEGETLTVGQVIMKVSDDNSNSQTEEKVTEEVSNVTKLEPIGSTKSKDDIQKLEENINQIKQEHNIEGDIPAIPKTPQIDKSLTQEINKVVEETKPVQEESKVEEPKPNVEQVPTPIPEVKEEPKPVEEKPIETPKPQPTQTTSNSNEIIAMPNIKHIAKEKGIDLSSVKGSGKHGQITLEDLGETKPSTETKPVQEEPKVEESKSVEEKPVETPKPQPAQTTTQDIIATPSIRKLARELGVDINIIKGSGDNGRILESDLKPKTETPSVEEEPKVEQTPTPQPVQTPITNNSNEDTIIEMTNIRKIISQRMMESLQKSAQVTHTDEANISVLVGMRNSQKEILKEQGIKLSYLPFFMKAYVESAKKFPMFNALIDDAKEQIIQKKDFNCGIAADTSQGLLVPVINNVDKKNILDIAKEITEVATLARDNKLGPDKMQNSTFTLSSVGSLGGQVFTPIINYPQTCILGIGKIIKKPIVKDDQVIIADMVTFSLTFDHRIIDGADAAKFLSYFIKHIENTNLLFMEL